MDKSKSIVPLAQKWEEFVEQAAATDISIEKFALWVLRNYKRNPAPSTGITAPKAPPFKDDLLKQIELLGDYPAIPTHSGIAGYIVSRLFKALRFYLKPAMGQHGLSGMEDLFFLSNLAWKSNISKKTLCQLAMTDIPTGMDVIKRLLKQGLIIETENPSDLREKLISLSNDGRKKVIDIYIDIAKTQDVLADLDDNERRLLIKLLDKLNCFHTIIYNAHTNPGRRDDDL